MNEFEDFLFELYHAKIQVIGIQSGDLTFPWDVSIQMKIYELPKACADYEIEALIIAAKSYFKDLIDYAQIITVIGLCAQQDNQINQNAFYKSVFNRLKSETTE